jgi:hypothetical protein
VIAPPHPLEDGTEVMGTPNPGFWGRLSVIVGRDVDGRLSRCSARRSCSAASAATSCFPKTATSRDARAHLAARRRVFLTDLGSSNGTFLRLRSERTCPTGSYMLMGQQLFRLEFR